MPETTTILIADDHRLFREGLKALLGALDGFTIVAEAATGREAIGLALDLQPDVILMDLQMPDLNGLEATQAILNASPQIGILILSMFEDDENVFRAMQAGARGYLLKGADHGELVRAMMAVANGEAIFAPSIARRLMGFFATKRSNIYASPHYPSGVFPELTEREREILALIAQGHPNPAIARKLEVSDKTVRNHITSIFSKLQVTSRSEAIVRAKAGGM
jgi:DNA-binding NarL/FixJ family response regulator